MTEDAGVPFHELQAEQIRLFREAWAAAGHSASRGSRSAGASSPWSTTGIVRTSGGATRTPDQVGYIDAQTKAIFGRSYAAEPDVLVEELAKDTAIQAADTLLLTVPNQLGVEYNAHAIESILKYVAPGARLALAGRRFGTEGPLGRAGRPLDRPSARPTIVVDKEALP